MSGLGTLVRAAIMGSPHAGYPEPAAAAVAVPLEVENANLRAQVAKLQAEAAGHASTLRTLQSRLDAERQSNREFVALAEQDAMTQALRRELAVILAAFGPPHTEVGSSTWWRTAQVPGQVYDHADRVCRGIEP